MSKKTEALLSRLKDNLEAEADKDARIERARLEAMARTLNGWLDGLDDPARAAIFAGLETNATARDRKLIAGHKLRPKEADALLATQAGAPAEQHVKPAPTKEGDADHPST